MKKSNLVVGLLALALATLSAQTGGQIADEVRDPSGSSIPGAAVTVT